MSETEDELEVQIEEIAVRVRWATESIGRGTLLASEALAPRDEHGEVIDAGW